jgi:hypothetical protein
MQEVAMELKEVDIAFDLARVKAFGFRRSKYE